jgi:hypothetical protein
MVRKLKVRSIEPSAAATETSEQEQKHDHESKTDVALFEATPDTEVDAAVVESASAEGDATAIEKPRPEPIIVDFSATTRKPRTAAKPRTARNSEPHL